MTTTAVGAPDEPFLDPSQLCIGLHVHLDMPWAEHPFPFSSFRIKSMDQIAAIQSLRVARLRYSADKSVAAPLPPPPVDEIPPPSPEPAPELAPELAAGFEAKRRRLERLAAHRAQVAACEKQLLSSARAVKTINQNLFARPDEAKREAVQLTAAMAASLLVDADIAIHLMAEKLGGEDTYHHALNVALLSMMLGKELGLDAQAVHMVGIGALFHDIGKLDLPDRIVRKTDALTRAEASALQQHCPIGVEMARRLALPAGVVAVIGQHHEQADGRGYPKRLTGAQITLAARIVAIANRYDNLCNPTLAAKALTPHEALSVMYGQQRSQFDTAALTTFVRCLGIYPPGTVVVLSNDAIGIVTSINSTRPLKPTVMVYDPTLPRDEAVIVDLELEPDILVSRTLRPQQLPEDVHTYLSPRRRMTYYFDAQRKA